MILDTSGLLAILLGEPEAGRFARYIETADVIRLSAASYLEASIVADRSANAASRNILDTFLTACEIIIEPVTVKQARLARKAYREFGKGVHPAGLNFGDCFTYALAKEAGEAVLFKGRDFSLTDLEAVDTAE